jgi:hypothetical protein
MVYLGGGIVSVSALHIQRPEQLGFSRHDRKTLAGRHCEDANIGIEYIEREDPVWGKVPRDRCKGSQDVFDRAQVEQRVARDEDERKPAAEIELTHVALHKLN